MKLDKFRETRRRNVQKQSDIMNENNDREEVDSQKHSTQDLITAEMEEFFLTKVDEHNFPEVIRKCGNFAQSLNQAFSGREERTGRAVAKPITYVGGVALLMKAALGMFGPGSNYTRWVDHAFSNIGRRKVHEYAAIAKISGVHPWNFLGKTRLMKIAPLLVGQKGDPIGDLFTSLGIEQEAAATMKRKELIETWARIMAKAKTNRKSPACQKKMDALKKCLKAELEKG